MSQDLLLPHVIAFHCLFEVFHSSSIRLNFHLTTYFQIIRVSMVDSKVEYVFKTLLASVFHNVFFIALLAICISSLEKFSV